MKTRRISSNIMNLLFAGLILLAGIGCRKASIIDLTTNDVNITSFLDRNPDQFSEFRKVLERSETSSFLQAYGAYTLFLPTNEAFKAYLTKKGKVSVNDFTKEELFDLVTFHVVPDSIKTLDFTDGKLRNATMYGQYLLTGAVNDPITGESKIQIDKQANMLRSNISVGNGIIHVIDQVMQPATLSVVQMLEADPKYSIFVEAIKATGYYDRLNQNPKTNPVAGEKYLTVFAESNAALEAAGFKSLKDLEKRYSKTGDPKNPADSLNLYVAYHIANGALYFVDMVNPVRMVTLAGKGVTSLNKSKSDIVLDEVSINGVVEPGSPLSRANSDLSARNGVIHAVGKHFKIVYRPAAAVYWEITDQPEFRAQAGWRSATITWDLSKKAPMANIFWNNKKTANYRGNYGKGFNNDMLNTPMAATSASGANATNRANYFEFRTPYLAPGRYKVWYCYFKSGAPGNITFSFNGVKFKREIFMDKSSDMENATDEAREQNGWKRYMGPVTTKMDEGMGRLLGTVEVTEGGPQVFRQDLGGGAYGNEYYVDMIHFIPEKDEQIWPRFWKTGRIQQKGEPD